MVLILIFYPYFFLLHYFRHLSLTNILHFPGTSSRKQTVKTTLIYFKPRHLKKGNVKHCAFTALSTKTNNFWVKLKKKIGLKRTHLSICLSSHNILLISWKVEGIQMTQKEVFAQLTLPAHKRLGSQIKTNHFFPSFLFNWFTPSSFS